MRGVGLAILSFCAVSVMACSHAPVLPASSLGFGDFVEQVLKPLAAERTDEVLGLEKARITAQYTGISLTALGAAAGAAVGAYSTAGLGTGVGAAVGGAIGGVIDARREADRKRAIAHLEAQRIPLQHRLLDLFTERTAVAESIYSLCAMGKHRRYELRNARFARLEDDASATCPLRVVPIYSES